MSIDLLQELGLNKYEAEAYYTLLTQGPLTGYELGKRSQVPLSRSYDVLERLSQRGLALAQPGDPIRYKALEPELFLGQVRSTMEHTLNTLARTLAMASQESPSDEFWVVRGHQHILTRAQALCSTAMQNLQIALPERYTETIATRLSEARQRGCAITLLTQNERESQAILLLIDGREALLGTLGPGEHCQAVVSANPALLTLLLWYFSTTSVQLTTATPSNVQTASYQDKDTESDWLVWENRKQQRLWKNRADQRIA
ncbi:MAG TPA: helix-turn-helix domain-containing protein [Ktedonobacteraceae bacterium]|nr:helix-turn-helix domain-containing protein [Ktedonobacteraceae bacterium]